MSIERREGMVLELWDGTRGSLHQDGAGWRIDWEGMTPAYYLDLELDACMQHGSI